MATKTAAKPKTKKTVTKTAKKASPARKTATKKTAAKKAPAKKAVAKKAVAKKTVTKKVTQKKAPTAKKAPAQKKAATKTASEKAPVKKKAPAKRAAAKKTTVKTVKKAVATPAEQTDAVETAEAQAPVRKPANVGQAPRKTTLTASIPTPTQIPPRDGQPELDEKSSQNAEASSSAKQNFKVKDKIVYPAHGVGMIVGLEKQQVAGITIELFVIHFDQEKMKLRVPTGKAKAAGMRSLSSDKVIKDAITLLKGRARIKRTMWSRRAQEYDAKINSGDIKLVAEVVRDLYRADDQPEQSYSERQLFEAALDRMAREVAAVNTVDLGAAIEELESTLRKKATA